MVFKNGKTWVPDFGFWIHLCIYIQWKKKVQHMLWSKSKRYVASDKTNNVIMLWEMFHARMDTASCPTRSVGSASHSIMGQLCLRVHMPLRKFPPSWVCSHSKFTRHLRKGRDCSHTWGIVPTSLRNNENTILWAPKLTLFVKLDILRPNSPKFLYCGSTVSKHSEWNLMANYNGFTNAIIFDSSSHKSA